MYVCTSPEGKRESSEELVDISSGQSKAKIYGFPIKEE